MSDPKRPKGFLGETNGIELDEWDATFDALHGGPEAGTGTEPVMEWPVAAASDDVGDRTDLVDPGRTMVQGDFASDLAEELTLDGELRVERTAVRVPAPAPALVDPLETDFSDVGAASPPAALGQLLGRPGAPAPAGGDDGDDFDEPETRIREPGVIGSRHAPTLRPASIELTDYDGGDAGDGVDDDDEVFTSASRPALSSFEDTFDVDPIAPPPTPAEVRRTPAIVRRGAAASSAAVRMPTTTSLDADATRVMDSRDFAREAGRSDKITLPPPIAVADDDDYADIEIDGEQPVAPRAESSSGGMAAASPVPVAWPADASGAFVDPGLPARRTAHTLRRGDAATRPPPTVPLTPTALAVEIPTAPAVPRVSTSGGEDDFSDVAAAVGGEVVTPAPKEPPQDPFAALDAAFSDFEVVDERPAAGVGAEDDFAEDAAPEPAPAPAPEPEGRPEPEAWPAREELSTMADSPSAIARDEADLAAHTATERPARAESVGITIEVDVSPPGGDAAEVHLADSEPEPHLDLEAAARTWPEQAAPLPTAMLDEAAAQILVVFERELATLDDNAASAALRIEAGRLCERLLHSDRARAHYDAALFADPRATPALRGLRRIARASGDLVEATRQIDAEIAVAGALERRPLGHYRVDLLMAGGEQDMARVAVGEILDSAPSDVRALLAHLELAFLDGRTDELGAGLEALARAMTDANLRAAVQTARGVLAAHRNDANGAIGWFHAAAESDPAALAARLGAIRHAAAQGDGPATATALLELARQVESTDPTTAAAAGIRALHWTTGSTTPLGAAALALVGASASSDPLAARIAAEAATDAGDPALGAAAYATWSQLATVPSERAYAAARAAELDPARGIELWGAALASDPGDDYAAAQLRTAHVEADATQAAIEVDLAVAADPERDRARLRAAYGLIAQGSTTEAILVLSSGREARPAALALAEALGEALAGAGQWTQRAELFAQLADDPGEQLDRGVAGLRSALAWEEAVGAAAEAQEEATDPEVAAAAATALERALKAALAAWERVIQHGGARPGGASGEPPGAVASSGPGMSPMAHAATMVLAQRLGDVGVIDDVFARTQAAERAPWAAASLGLRRARHAAAHDPALAISILRELRDQTVGTPAADDPRRTVSLVLAAARRAAGPDVGEAAGALEERASQLESRGAVPEVAALRLRAAQLALDDGDAPRATRLLEQVERALPTLGVVPDLLAAARRRAGDRPVAPTRRVEVAPGASSADAFARLVRDADLASHHGEGAAAVALYQQALELRPGDPLATVPMIRVASRLDDPDPVTALALAQLRVAEDANDALARGAAYELLAHVDGELRGQPAIAQGSLESAVATDPTRGDLRHRIERHYAVVDQIADLIRLRAAELAAIPEVHVVDRAALQLDLAGLATRDGRVEDELAALYRATLATEPRTRLALLHLESIVRRAGVTPELAALEEQIAMYFEGDPKTQAAFWTRAGGTLAELNQIDEAVQRFGKAEAALPGHVPALEGWRHAALKGQLWIDVAEAASRHAIHAPDAAQRAALHHFAGVALMDKALEGEQARQSFRRALDAMPGHRDSFLRMRILLEEDADHDDLATLLAQRLSVEEDPTAQMELHRALAELHRNFLSDRDTAKEHYRAILEADASDLRSHAALADIAWEQGNWQEAAEELTARARLERQPDVLRTLCFRLGLIYADRLVDVPMALKAFQRALTYEPDDENTLVRLADLAVQVGEWKLALAACERLVKNETDPDRRAAHLHRVAKIFKEGFNDLKRAERALILALDGAPTNSDALQHVVQFYKETRDVQSVRVHLNRVAGTMRTRVAKDPRDGDAYRVLSRAMSARAATALPGSMPIARAAAELARLLGAASEAELKLLQTPSPPDISLVLRPEADELLFPRGAQQELRHVFHLLGDRIAKHVGVDLRPYGVTRGDRLRAKENPAATVAQSVATQFGLGEIDVYVSSKLPWAMVAEPTSPVSLILGSAIASAGGDAIRFATGAALKLSHASLAVPARLSEDELGVLVIALLRLFQPEFPMLAVDPDAVATQSQKLRRLIPSNLLTELRPYALAVDAARFSHRELARDLRIGALRAGLVASGSVLAGISILAGQAESALPGFLADPVVQGLVTFALGEDHAAVAR